FPPEPPNEELLTQIIQGFVEDLIPSKVQETGCAVCGILCPQEGSYKLKDIQDKLNMLSDDGRNITRKERKIAGDPVEIVPGPILAENCDSVCENCINYLKTDRRPIHALANGLWLGLVPKELKNFTLAEKLLIAKVRHNRCVVRVSSGMYKMHANAIMFANPTPKIYHT
ncbi:hypothetical protein OE88DRAFT_1606545, partial [Heliocybe sulcata]